MDSREPSLLDIYRNAALGNPSNTSLKFWGEIPSSFSQIGKILEKQYAPLNFQDYEENLEKLRQIATQNHRKYGTLTSSVKESLEKINNGIIEVSHQPLFLGGPVFIFNKVALTEWLGKLSNLGTLFFIGDHDSIQNELTVARFPQSNSSSGLTLNDSTITLPALTPIHQVSIPSESWFQENRVKIQENLRLLFKYANIKLEYRQLLFERFNSWFNLIYSKAISSNNFSNWIQRIWSQLFNVISDKQLFLLPSSNLEYRKLVISGFEFLLTEQNRITYIQILNDIYNYLMDKNISPGLPYRSHDYVPFFMECSRCINKTRIELRIREPGTLVGKCTNCNEEYDYTYNSVNPDLSDIATIITPRSDSRAVVNCITFPIFVHIGGGGETKYYSAVIPAMRRLKLPTPVLIRSNRIFYNTPWGVTAANDNQTPILKKEVYDIFEIFNNSSESQEIVTSLKNMHNYLRGIFSSEEQILNAQIEELKANSKNIELRRSIRTREIMLSLNFGRFAPQKSNQEVSWNWLDLALLTGINNIVDIFQRQLKEGAYLGHTWYINPGKFN